jgi:hypothetical protein
MMSLPSSLRSPRPHFHRGGTPRVAPRRRKACVPTFERLEELVLLSGGTVTINFDNLPVGTVVTNQYPGVTFSSGAGYGNIVTSFAEYGGSEPNTLGAFYPAGGAFNDNTYLDFSTPVNNLRFLALADNAVGTIAQVNVYENGKYASTVPIVGDDNAYTPCVVDLTSFHSVTRIEIVGDTDPAGLVYDDFQFDAKPIDITSLSTKTFVTTDEIQLQATVAGAPAGTKVLWTVQGQDAAAGVTGFPTNFVTTTDAAGVATFRFVPADNQALVNNRRTQWTKGSLQANTAITFQVTAKATLNGTTYETKLSDTNLGPLSQDETDRLRQEYEDYGIPVPARSEVVPSVPGGFNTGNYGVQLSVGLDTHFNAILGAYRGRRVTVVIDGQPYNTTIPTTANLGISSAYRNPQRNHHPTVGSVHPDSRHTRGRALDLVPTEPVRVTVVVNRRPRVVTLPLHEVVYPALQAAAATQGTAIAEHSAIPVPVGDPSENHIHVQW